MRDDTYKNLGSIKGIEGFIVADRNGQSIEHQIDDPETMAAIVARCGRNMQVIGKSNFSHAVIKRRSSRDILIFPIGNHYIGMVKKKDIKTDKLIHTIKNMITKFTFGR